LHFFPILLDDISKQIIFSQFIFQKCSIQLLGFCGKFSELIQNFIFSCQKQDKQL
jgi:hypothetical protein